MENKTLIAICIPSMDMVHADFAMHLAELFAYPTGTFRVLINTKASIIALNRNISVDFAQKRNADWILFLDSDMTFPASTLKQLLAHDKYIVGATYCKRAAPFETLGAPINEQERNKKSGLVEMSCMPTGCLLIRTSVFDKFKKPYFRCKYDEEKEMMKGEDYFFCEVAKNLGYQIWCDLDLSKEIGHIGQQVFKIQPTN